VTDVGVEAQVNQTLARISKIPHVTDIVSPYSSAGSGNVNSGGTSPQRTGGSGCHRCRLHDACRAHSVARVARLHRSSDPQPSAGSPRSRGGHRHGERLLVRLGNLHPAPTGAKMEAVAGALGNSLQAAFDRWHEWALRQRDFIIDGKPGITEDEYEAVARRFASLGIMSSERGASAR